MTQRLIAPNGKWTTKDKLTRHFINEIAEAGELVCGVPDDVLKKLATGSATVIVATGDVWQLVGGVNAMHTFTSDQLIDVIRWRVRTARALAMVLKNAVDRTENAQIEAFYEELEAEGELEAAPCKIADSDVPY